jgi:hypothetical protein
VSGKEKWSSEQNDIPKNSQMEISHR